MDFMVHILLNLQENSSLIHSLLHHFYSFGFFPPWENLKPHFDNDLEAHKRPRHNLPCHKTCRFPFPAVSVKKKKSFRFWSCSAGTLHAKPHFTGKSTHATWINRTLQCETWNDALKMFITMLSWSAFPNILQCSDSISKKLFLSHTHIQLCRNFQKCHVMTETGLEIFKNSESVPGFLTSILSPRLLLCHSMTEVL